MCYCGWVCCGFTLLSSLFRFACFNDLLCLGATVNLIDFLNAIVSDLGYLLY